MKRHIINTLSYAKIALLLMALLFATQSCKDESDTMLRFENEVVTLGPEDGSTSIILRSNTEWKVVTTGEWFRYNLTKGASSASIVLYFTKNETGEVREKEIVAQTLDGALTTKLKLRQLPSGPYISLEPKKIALTSDPANYLAKLETNVEYEKIEIEINYGDDGDGEWITNITLGNQELHYSVTENLSAEKRRQANIVLTHIDEFDRIAEAVFGIVQMFTMNPAVALPKTIDYVKAIEVGEVGENIYVSGVVVALGNGVDHNYRSNRYIIQDTSNKSLVIQSDVALTLSLGDQIDLWLLGAEMAKTVDNQFEYPIIKGVADLNIIEQTAGQSPTPKEMFMAEITDVDINTLVKLKDVEVAIPFGSWCNYNLWYLSEAQLVNSPAFVQNHPVCIRDIQGNHMYALANINAAFARSPDFPKGSGPSTGIVVNEKNPNMGDIGKYQIRPQVLSDIGLNNDRAQGFSEVLAEWDGAVPSDLTQTFIRPSAGTATGATFFKSNAPSLSTGYNAAGHIYFIEDYRAGVKKDKQTMNSANWGPDVWWIIKDVSTVGIANTISLQIETNSNDQHGPKNFIVEWSLDETSWSPVAGGAYIVHGQYVSARRFVDYNPGYKCYNFDLPSELLGQSNIFVRFRCANTQSVNSHQVGNDVIAVGSTNRVAHVSMKYNK